MATVVLTPEATEQLERLPKVIHARLNRLRERLERWPHISGAKALSGDLAGWFRLRTGDYRLRFRVQDETIIVDKIGHRGISMKTKAVMCNRPQAQYRKIDGQRVVVLPETDYERLLQQADLWEPLLPEPNADGSFPAKEYMLVSLARKVLRHRRRLGLTQVELARRAGIRPETLNRIEQGKTTPSVATIEKIDRALRRAERAAAKRGD